MKKKVIVVGIPSVLGIAVAFYAKNDATKEALIVFLAGLCFFGGMILIGYLADKSKQSMFH